MNKNNFIIIMIFVALAFAYADATTLRIQGYYVKDKDGWITFLRGEAEPNF